MTSIGRYFPNPSRKYISLNLPNDSLYDITILTTQSKPSLSLAVGNCDSFSAHPVRLSSRLSIPDSHTTLNAHLSYGLNPGAVPGRRTGTPNTRG